VGRDARLILCDIAADPVNTVTVSLGGKSTNSSQIHYLRLTLFSVDFHQIDNVRQRILQERQRNFRRGCHGRIYLSACGRQLPFVCEALGIAGRRLG
jgi:hypothetical protein